MQVCKFMDSLPANPNPLRNRRDKLKLDFENINEHKRSYQSILTSPDLNMLKLASPELENFIRSQPMLFTPTPSQYYFPRSFMNEREMYAKGFLDAISTIKHYAINDPHKMIDSNNNSLSLQDNTCNLTAQINCSKFTQLCDMNNKPSSSSHNSFLETIIENKKSDDTDSITSSLSNHTNSTITSCIKHEGEMIDNADNNNQFIQSGLSNNNSNDNNNLLLPPSLPINLENQEKIKIERKRLRNRIAASKCRRRKIERISELEQLSEELKNSIENLEKQILAKNNQVTALQNEIQQHIQLGCHCQINR